MEEKGAEQMFMNTFAEFGDAIFRFCVVKVSNTALAEDMTQEVFMRYWQYLRAGKEMTNTRALLYTIAHNLAKDWYKKKKSESLEPHLELGHEPATSEASPEAHAEQQELIATIEDMAPLDKEVLLLTYVEGLEPREIAAALGENANTISVRLNRAMKRLRTKLEHD